ncbi:MAG: ribosome biogenesis GTPase Der [Deltaproteobacteria bacterium]|nr:ribosome biogenesis GTPase Der [Deltaproteobacteria bacterium]
MTGRAKGGKRVRPHAHGIPAGATGALPLVAIVGRPNVGKSTLFNKLARKRIAIVEDVPGVTRDRHYADTWMLGRDVVLVDTGGFDPESDDPMQGGIANHVRLALEEADVIIGVLDATADPLPADREAVKLLRRSERPVLWIANKCDSPKQVLSMAAHYELGIDQILPVSALHSRGLGDLEEAIVSALPEAQQNEGSARLDAPRIAIVGRPNAGKSSLVNRLVGEERQLVDDRPGTTVDSVDTLLERKGQALVLIDTAGMRKKKRVHGSGVEASSVFAAIRAMERGDVVVLMIDANEGVGEQDAKIAGLAHDRGRALVIALNKIDLLSAEQRKAAVRRTQEILAFAPWAPILTLSAKTGRNVGRLIEAATRAVIEHRKRIPTGEVNRFFEEVLEKHPPPSMHHRPVRFYYITQPQSRPPTFMVSTNHPDGVHFSYQRYVINQIRQRFGFEGTPIRVRYRGRGRAKQVR